MLIRVRTMWLNPDAVIGIWVRHTTYHGEPETWVTVLRCEEGQVWEWPHLSEEAAHSTAEQIAAQVNGTYVGKDLR